MKMSSGWRIIVFIIVLKKWLDKSVDQRLIKTKYEGIDEFFG